MQGKAAGELDLEIRRHSPGKYELRPHQPYPVTFSSDKQIHCIQAAKCTYDRMAIPAKKFLEKIKIMLDKLGGP